MISLYHPFWNNPIEHNIEIDSIVNIVDWTRINKNPNCNIIVCGDFNDLRHHTSSIEQQLSVSNVVNFATGGNNCLDLVLSNCRHLYHDPQPINPFGSSDHCTIIWSSKLKTEKLKKVSKSIIIKDTGMKHSNLNFGLK